MISLDHISHRYRLSKGREVVALDDISLRVEPGRFIALKGPSGCGKSTLLLITGGLLRPEGGGVRVLDAEPYTLPPDARARFRAHTIGFVFQQFHLVPYLDVLGNVMLPSLATGEQDPQRARGLLEDLGLQDRAHHLPATLSTGERQRAALARALYANPRVLLADEPTGNLDKPNAETVLNHLARFATAGGAVLMVSHDTQATAFADQVLGMERGKLVPNA